MDIEAKLRSLGVEEAILAFQENNIDNEAVLLLGDDELKELIPKMGPRAKFKKYIESFKIQDISLSLLDDYVKEPSASSDVKLVVKDSSESSEVESIQSGTDKHNTGCLEGRAILKDRDEGLLKEGTRRKLSQLIINYTIERKPAFKISSEEFYRLASEIVEIFPKENVVVYYSAYHSGKEGTAKKNASGKLYESYITRRRKLRQSGELLGTSRASSSTSSSSTTINSSSPVVSEDGEINEDVAWLKNNVDPWETVKEKWSKTSKYRLSNLGLLPIHEYYERYPCLQQPQGYALLLDDFNWIHPNKENKLFSTIQLKQQDIIAHARRKLEHGRDKITTAAIGVLIKLIDGDDSETVTNVCLILLAYIINISPARKRKGKPTLKFSRAEICEGFIKQVSSEEEVTTAIIEKKEEILLQKRTLQPFIIFVGQSVAEVKAAYVIINSTVYHFSKLITAVDCAFKIFQSTGACYPEESEDIWLFIQLGIYNIRTEFDRHTQVVNTLMTDLGLMYDNEK